MRSLTRNLLEIIDEYKATVAEMIERKQGNLNAIRLDFFLNKLLKIDSVTVVKICRDPNR